MTLRVLLLAAVAAFAAPSAAQSSVVTFDWLGKITEIQGGGSAYSVGETLKFSLTYDTDALASQIQNGGTTAVYTSGMQFIRFGWEMWSVDNSSIFGQSQVSNNRPATPSGFVDEVIFQGQNYGSNEAYVTFLFTLAGASPQALNSTALPGGFVNPSAFGSAIATYNINGVTYVAELNAVQAVPEPATWAMMLLGFAAVGFVAYHRSRKLVAVAA